jgi:hypothetical protein
VTELLGDEELSPRHMKKKPKVKKPNLAKTLPKAEREKKNVE